MSASFGRLRGMNGAVLGGRYRLTRPIGSGGMAVVWEARDEVLGREVAVKVLAGRHVDDPESRELIRHEARAAASLSHPNIAQVHDYGETASADGVVPFVVMELIRGDTLLDRASRTNLPPSFAMRVCAEVAAALAAAHSEGIVHRDVKPANVMLAPTGAKVVDFGIAAAVAPGRTDEDFEVLGTPAYLAPERLISDVVEPASDVYALAILLYQLLAGCLPWTSETTTQMLTAHIYVDPIPLGPTPGVPDYVVSLCNRCLAKDPTLRPSAREVAAVLAHGARVRVAIPDPSLDGPRSPFVFPPAAAPTGSTPPAASLGGPPAAPESLRAAPAATAAPGAPAAAARPHAGNQPSAASPGGPANAAQSRAGNQPSAASPGGPAMPAGSDRSFEDRPSADAAPAIRRPFPVRRWAATAATVAVVVLAAWLFWPDGSSGNSPAAVAPAVLRPTAPSSGPAAESASPASSPHPAGATGSEATPRTRPSAPAVAGAGSPSPTAHPTTKASTASPEPGATPTVRQLTSSGGSVQATCPAPATAQILSADPTEPFKVLTLDTAPGASPAAVFKHGKARVTMTVECRSGVPATTNSASG